ncbi:MAG: ATP-binding cassette domain-containing protein [Deltaproteobacteria bacterium]|nr:ATP-binding cassette domain-containing protein [Deltaproteobacteria bacterium]
MLSVRDLGYRHPTASAPALQGVSFDLLPGEMLLVHGPTGCGKSTLARLCAGLLQRHGGGLASGRVLLDGHDVAALPPAARVGQVAFVAQDPADQLVTGTLGDELAFAAESAGMETEAIRAAVSRALHEFGLPPDPARPVTALSTGQTQRLVVAAAMSAGARLLVLDEPLAHLDPGASEALLVRLRALAEGGAAVLLVEHRLALARRHATRELALGEHCAVSRHTPVSRAPGPRVATLDGASFHYGAHRVLDRVSLALHRGDRVSLVGPNGAGKSTLLRMLAEAPGALPVPQDPDLSLFCPTVREELLYGPAEHGHPVDLPGLVADFDLGELLDRAPQSLSRGQRLRVALAAAVATRPSLLLLDEPTAAQDPAHVHDTMAAVDRHLDGALVFATHDLDLAATAPRRYHLREGRLHEGPS